VKEVGMCETVMITIALPGFILEGNALLSGHLNMQSIIDLGPINFHYLILVVCSGQAKNLA